MIAVFERVLSSWDKYWGTGYYHWILLIAVAYLLIFRRKNKTTIYLLTYLAILLFLFFCPFSAKIIFKCIGKKVYWRVLWLLQLIPTIAFAATEFLKERKRTAQAVLILVFVGVTALCGKGIYAAQNYHLVHNFQQVPDEVAAIGDMIRADAGDFKVMVVADTHISGYLRVYDPSFYMMFGRDGRGAVGPRSKQLYAELNSPAPNHRNIGWLGRYKECNYVVVKITDASQKENMAEFGYQEVGLVNEYGVFRYGENVESCRNYLLFPEKTDTV